MLRDILARIERRLSATGQSPRAASMAAGLSPDAIRNIRRYVEQDRDDAGLSTVTLLALAPVLGTTASWLLEGVGPEGEPLVPIVGRAGSTPDGRVIPVGSHQVLWMVPPPPGVSTRGAAIEIEGHALRGVVDDGSLIYYDEAQSEPNDLVGGPAVVQLEEGPLMIVRLLRGPAPGLYDLEPLSGPMITSARIEWAAPISARIAPGAAEKVVRRPDPGASITLHPHHSPERSPGHQEA